jgi:hypothetical protein
VSDVISTFSRGEEFERGCDQGRDVIEGARPCGEQKRLQFGECELDRIEVGTVGWKKGELGADLLDGGADLWLFVNYPVIQHHHVAMLEGRHEELFDIREETGIVDRAIEYRCRAHAVEPQRRDHRVRLAVAAVRDDATSSASESTTAAYWSTRENNSLRMEYANESPQLSVTWYCLRKS